MNESSHAVPYVATEKKLLHSNTNQLQLNSFHRLQLFWFLLLLLICYDLVLQFKTEMPTHQLFMKFEFLK